jgi:hypothetical protein
MKVYETIAKFNGVTLKRLNSNPPWFDVFMIDKRQFKSQDLSEAFGKMMELANCA